MIANFWPGATLEQFQVEMAHLEGKEQPQAQLLRTVAEVEGGLMIVSLWEGQAQYDSWAGSHAVAPDRSSRWHGRTPGTTQGTGGGSLLRAACQLSGWGQSGRFHADKALGLRLTGVAGRSPTSTMCTSPAALRWLNWGADISSSSNRAPGPSMDCPAPNALTFPHHVRVASPSR